ncbi:hypothetical protein [Thermococcus sp.]
MEEIEAIFYIEGLSSDKKALENALKETSENLKNERNLKITEVNVEEVIEEGEEPLRYSGVITARVRGPFDELVRAVLKYGPAIVEVVKPGKFEIGSEELVKILGEVSLVMGKLMERFGGLAAYPDLNEFPEPKIGFPREKIEELITDDRYIRYRFVIEVSGKDEETVKKTMAKAFSLEGCLINSLILQGEQFVDKYRGLLAAELLSPFDVMFQLTAKYAPVAISIVEPEIVDITANELQNALTDLGGFVNELVTRPVKKMLMEKHEKNE